MLGGVLGPRLRRRSTPYLFLAPGYLVFAIFMLYPLAKAIQISFYHWELLPGRDSTFIGLSNYAAVLRDPISWVALRNTVLYAIGTVPTQIVLGLLVASLLDSITRLRVFFRTLYYLPVITSWVVVSILFKYLFSSDAGFANFMLHDVLHVLPGYVGWLQEVPTALFVIALLGVWKGTGWSMLIFLAALQSIPKETIDKRQEACTAAKKICEVKIYPDAPHGFLADYRPSYRADAAKDGWALMLAWFKKYGVA